MDETGIGKDGTAGEKTDLAVIRAQLGENGDLLRLNTELLKRLIEMMLPKADPDAQPLQELLSLLLAQQRQILVIVQQQSSDIGALKDALLDESRSAANGAAHG
jgi:hypothetical protein